MTDPAIAELTKAANRLNAALERLDQQPRGQTVTVALNAGGLGVWIATTCCAVAVAVCLTLALAVSDLRREIGEAKAALFAIYAQAPHLRPQPEDSRP